MRFALLAVLFFAFAQAWPRKAHRGNRWVKSSVEKDVSGQTESWSKWGNKLSNRLIAKETEDVTEDPVVAVDPSSDDDETFFDKVKTFSSKRGQSSDSDDMETTADLDTVHTGSDDKVDDASSDSDEKRDSDDKDFVVRSRSPPFFNKKDSEDIDYSGSSSIADETVVSKVFEPKFIRKNLVDLSKDFPKFDGPFLGREFEGHDSSMERKFDFPFNVDSKDSAEDEDCEKDSSKHDSAIDFSSPPKFDREDFEGRIPDFKDLSRKFKSHGEDSSTHTISEDMENNSSDHGFKPPMWKKRFDWRKFRPTFDSSSEDVKASDSVVMDDDVVSDDVTTPQGLAQDSVVPDESNELCENCGPSRRNL